MSDMPTAPPPFGWHKAIPLLLLAGFAAYTSAVNTTFVLDDGFWITRHPSIGNAAEYLRAGGGRLLVSLTVLVNHRLGGFNPIGYHLFNIAVHLAAGVTLFALLRRVLSAPRRAGRFAGRADGLAFAAALLWLVHPLNTSAVTYVIQRSESLMGLFFLLTFYCWTRAADGRRGLWLGLAVLSYAASCLSKEVAVTLPPLLVLFDRLFLAGSWREVFSRWPGYLGVAAVWAWKMQFALGAAGGGTDVGVGFGISLTPKQYALTQTGVILHYLRLSFWPVGLCSDYLDWPVANELADVWPTAVGLGLLLLASAAALIVRPAVGFLAAWFFVILSPTSSVVPIIDVAFEHRMYLSLIAVCVGVVLFADRLLALVPNPRLRTALGGLALVVAAVALGRWTLLRNTVYRSEAIFWEAASVARPNNLRAKMTVASFRTDTGQFDAADRLFAEVSTLAQQSRIYRIYRANWCRKSGDLSAAAELFRGLLSEQWAAKYRYTGGFAVRAFLAHGDTGEAAALTKQMVDDTPGSALYWVLHAAAELSAGRPTEAMTALEQATRIDLTASRLYAAEARELVMAKPVSPAAGRGNWELAYRFAAAAALSDAALPEWFDTLAQAAARTGRFPEAVAAAKRGIDAAERAGDTAWVSALQDRLKLYEAGKVYGPTD
jgi:tetratricopeptide (TPR) repeat protein